MSWPGVKTTLLAFVTFLAAALCVGQTLQKGVHVELPAASHAESMPDVDKEDAIVVGVTSDGTMYLHGERTDPETLPRQINDLLQNKIDRRVYLKADARTPFGKVIPELAAIRSTDALPNLLTAPPKPAQPGMRVYPSGLEISLKTPAGAKPVVVQVLSAGQQSLTLRVNNQPVSQDNLQSKLTQLLQNRRQKLVALRADGSLPFGQLVQVIDSCAAAGAKVVLPAQ